MDKLIIEANKLNEKCKYDIVLIGFYTSIFNIINKLTLNNLDNIELKLREDRKSYLNYIQGYFGCKVIKLLLKCENKWPQLC